LYKEILEVNDLSKVKVDQLMQVLKPESLFERFAARKANKVSAGKDFLDIKGQKLQMENYTTVKLQTYNPLIGFKCNHYSVTESAGQVEITIIKKNAN
jgi:hypothetical protein